MTIYNFINVNLAKTELLQFNFSPRIVPFNDIHVRINPYRIFQRIGNINDPLTNFNDFLTKVYSSEVVLRNSSEFNTFRETLLSITDYPVFPIGKIDYSITASATVVKTKRSIALTPVIWFPMHFIAFDKQIRELLMSYISNGLPVPKLLNELMLRTRSSRCGKSNIIPGLNTDEIDGFIDIIAPYLKNTFLDYRYLRTTQGLQSYINFLALISSSDYITKVSSDTLKTILLHSGHQTTQMSISILEQDPFSAQVMQGNSFSHSSPSEIHLLDAIFTSQCAFDSSSQHISISFSSEITLSGHTLDSLANYLVKRCLGITTNSLNLSSEPLQPEIERPQPPKAKAKPKKQQQQPEKVDFLESHFLAQAKLNEMFIKHIQQVDQFIKTFQPGTNSPIANTNFA